MAPIAITENALSGFEEQSGNADPLTNTATVPSIEESLTARLTAWRAEALDLRDKVKALPFGHPDRATHARFARFVHKRIAETVAILDRRHWVEEEGKAKRGRPRKVKVEEVEG